MRIPYSISPLTMEVYKRSAESENLIGEEGIKIDAQDLDWDNAEIPTLTTLCVRKIAFYFEDRPWFFEVPCSDRDYLLELLSLDLDIDITIPLIKGDYYWKRRYAKHFGTIIHPKPREWNWKSIYIEREVQRLVETASPQYKDEERIQDSLKLCAPYVKRLVVSQLAMWKPPLASEPGDIPDIWPTDHIDFTFILANLPLVEEFDLVFGMNDVAFDFCWDMFKVTVKDCQRLGKAILFLPSLSILRIHKSKIEDAQCQALMQSLVYNKSIVELDLSNCSIGNHGTLCISKFLSECPTLRILNLNNNLIGQTGAVGLAFALLQETCPPLETLHMSLNPLGRDGVVGIMRALVRCNIPAELSISAVHFEEDLIERLCQMLTVNTSLKILNVSSNWFGEEGGNILLEVLEENKTLEWLDMRETGITHEQELEIISILKRNRGVRIEFGDEDDEEKDKGTEEGKQDEDEDELDNL